MVVHPSKEDPTTPDREARDLRDNTTKTALSNPVSTKTEAKTSRTDLKVVNTEVLLKTKWPSMYRVDSPLSRDLLSP